jgi:glycosyltransferase involved in cell wall biosynthesis
MEIFFWTPGLDHLHLYTWKAIQSKIDRKITYVLTEPENHARKRQGWKAADLSMLDITMVKGKGWLHQSVNIIRQNPDAIHVFMGFWTDSRLFPLMVYAANHEIKTAVISEQYSTSPVGYMEEEKYIIARSKVILRPFLYRFAAIILKFVSNKKKQVCIFSVSPQAQEQYIKAGFDKNTIFPFGYFVPKMIFSINEYERTTRLRLVFVGVLLKRKGLDIAVSAIQKINQNGIKVTLDVYGSGDPIGFIPKDSNAITYKGIIPPEQAQAVIAQYDALLLPSRHDGWGVVVNEALLQGIPAIVSDHVGAKCLIEGNGAGLIFESENVDDLANQLIKLIETPGLLDNIRLNAENIYKYILPEVAAQYFINALEYHFYDVGTRPQALWCN